MSPWSHVSSSVPFCLLGVFLPSATLRQRFFTWVALDVHSPECLAALGSDFTGHRTAVLGGARPGVNAKGGAGGQVRDAEEGSEEGGVCKDHAGDAVHRFPGGNPVPPASRAQSGSWGRPWEGQVQGTTRGPGSLMRPSSPHSSVADIRDPPSVASVGLETHAPRQRLPTGVTGSAHC